MVNIKKFEKIAILRGGISDESEISKLTADQVFKTLERNYNAKKTIKNIYNTSKKEVQLNKIVAIVNTQVITQQELNTETDRTQKMLQQQGISLPGHIILEKQVLKQMITERLKLQLAKKRVFILYWVKDF